MVYNILKSFLFFPKNSWQKSYYLSIQCMTKKIIIKVINKNNKVANKNNSNSEIKLTGSSADKAKIYNPATISAKLKKNESRLVADTKVSQEKKPQKNIEIKSNSVEAKKQTIVDYEEPNSILSKKRIKKNNKNSQTITVKHKFQFK